MSTYSFKDVTASIVGPGFLGVAALGYGAGVGDEGITIEMAEDKNQMTIGADGKGMHSLHASRSGHVTIRLLKTSPQNQLLMQMYDSQTASSTLHGQNVITVSQTVSGDITTATQCAFKKKPNIKYGKDGDIMEWTFDSVHVDTVLGTYVP